MKGVPRLMSHSPPENDNVLAVYIVQILSQCVLRTPSCHGGDKRMDFWKSWYIDVQLPASARYLRLYLADHSKSFPMRVAK